MRALFAGSAVICIAFVAGCAPKAPQAELSAYLQSFDETYAVSNEVLDVVAEFERRNARAVADAPPAAAPAIDTSLLAAPIPAPTDPALAGTAVAACAADDRLGPTDYCFALRHAYATISDPPLTASYRRTLAVIHRYNLILAAYAEGRSGDLLAAELAGLQSDLGLGLAAADISIPQVGIAFGKLAPLASLAGSIGDRERFRELVLAQQPDVDAALLALMQGTETLFDNIAQDIRRRRIEGGAAGDAALDRQLAILRQVLANLTYLLDHSRTMLAELTLAVETPDSLESRLRNLGLISIESRIDAAAVRRDLAILGAGGN